MKKCEFCGKEIKGSYYDSQYGNGCVCEECGDERLTYEEEYETYIYSEDVRECYSDDYGVDIDRFDFVEVEKKYYIEIYDKSCCDVIILESKWFETAESAKKWFKEELDYFNNKFGVRLFSATFENGEQGDVKFEMHLK